MKEIGSVTSFEQYATNFDSKSPSSTNGKRCLSSLSTSNRAASSETKLHSLAEP